MRTRDTAQLCELVGGPGDPQALYDVDVGGDIIVRCHRKIVYPNGTIYSGFVDTATGLPDGEGSVTWGASAGRSSRKSYTGRFAAGLTAERLRFAWKEQRAGQISTGHHSYIGTVEVAQIYFFVCCCLGTADNTQCEQVKSGAWTGNAFIQYDVNEVIQAETTK